MMLSPKMRKYRYLFVQLPRFSFALSIIAINLAHHLWARYDITIFVYTLFVATIFVVTFYVSFVERIKIIERYVCLKMIVTAENCKREDKES